MSFFISRRSLAFAAFMTLTPLMATAATQDITGGQTTVTLDPGFVSALTSLQVAPAAISPSTLNKGVIRFTIPAGVVDESNLHAEILHIGGLQLTAGSNTVRLENFVIDTTGDPVLTGMVIVNGAIVGRLPLFTLDLSAATLPSNYPLMLIIDNVKLTLTSTAASALNGVFGITALTDATVIGTANVSAFLANPMHFRFHF